MVYRIVLFFLPQLVMASIFGTDDRSDFYEIRDSVIKQQSDSVVSLVRASRLQATNQGFKVKAKTLENGLNFCEDTRFAGEKMIANCTGALVAPKLILTAAHCVDDPEEQYIVFDYRKDSQSQIFDTFKADQVFKIKRRVYFDFEFGVGTTWNDIALLELDRASDRKPLKINYTPRYQVGTELYILGHPLGISQKLTRGEEIKSVGVTPNSFRHELDTFSVNSGSPIFNERTHQIIGVHVRGTGRNYKKYERECHDWYRGSRDQDYGEGNTFGVSAQVLRSLVDSALKKNQGSL